MQYTKIPTTAAAKLQLNAGILMTTFDPATPAVVDSNIIGATSGGITFSAIPQYSDLGEDIDNCPKNTKEMKHVDSWEIKISGTFVTADTAQAKSLLAAADIGSVDTTKITLRNNLLSTDFADMWFVGDYSDKNTGTTAGYIAIKMMNLLSTGGFKIKTEDQKKGKFDFEYTAHYSTSAQDTVPCEVYIKAGTVSSG